MTPLGVAASVALIWTAAVLIDAKTQTEVLRGIGFAIVALALSVGFLAQAWAM